MKNILVVLALISATATCATAKAANTSKPTNYRSFYMVGGHETPADQAIIASLNGHEAFKCTAVEAKLSKSGTSIGIKNIKKPKFN